MQAVILAAGQGTRLRAVSPSKPLTLLAGRPLLHHVLDRLAAAGVTRPIVLTGYRGDEVAASAHAWGEAETVHNDRWNEPNGVSVLAVADRLAGRALLVMADHLAAPGLYQAVASCDLGDAGVALGVDRRLGHPDVDEADVTRVATRDGRITAIGKHIGCYDCYDTGVFLITRALPDALASLPSPGLSDGVRRLAGEGRALAVDVSTHDWIDIDEPGMIPRAGAMFGLADPG